jgi:uncharacterized membrane protein
MTDERRSLSPRIYSLAGIILIIIWAATVLTTQSPGWIHLLLSVGLFLLIYGIVNN